MGHFPDQTWADFVRGVGSSETVREIPVHMARGCADCKTSFALWSGLGDFAAKERMYAPPENLVRLVRLKFANEYPSLLAPWTWAGMMFDSVNRPLPAGIRGAAVCTRQMVYEGEGLTVDVRFERKPHSNTISAAGQVLDKQVPLRWLGNADVTLSNEAGQMVANTEANNYGEFQLEFESQDQLYISIATDGRRTLRIPLGVLGTK